MFSDLHLYFFTNLAIITEILLCIFPSLPDLGIIVCIPCTALDNHTAVGGQVQNISYRGNTLPEHNVKFRLLKRRSNLIFYNLYTGMVADYLAALLQSLCPAYIQTNGGIKF